MVDLFVVQSGCRIAIVDLQMLCHYGYCIVQWLWQSLRLLLIEVGFVGRGYGDRYFAESRASTILGRLYR